MRFAMLAACCALAASACHKDGGGNDSKMMPKTPPPPELVVPDGVSIAVEVDGKALPAIDSARLTATKPDFEDAEHRAWRIASLIGAPADGAGAMIGVSGPDGILVMLPHPEKADDSQPALMLARRGMLVATMVSPKDPFPGYHGQGRRLGRAGDPSPHVVNVTRIQVSSRLGMQP